MSSKPLNEAIRSLPASWFRPNPIVYWADLIASAATGWIAFALAVRNEGWPRAAFLIVSAFALYRAVLFIHELTHLSRRDVPGFRAVWNATVGIPLLVPSFLYEMVHNDHHRQRVYGTAADPEYVPFGRRSPALIAAYVVVSALAPLLLVLRFAVIAPLSWVFPPLRRLTAARWSALAINPGYVRTAPLDTAARVEEAAACTFAWAVLLLWRAALIPGIAFACWLGIAASTSTANALRTLAAHRYDHEGGELTMTEQLLDSCTIVGERAWRTRMTAACRAAIAPVGLRYHALHHWIPSLPYHNLGRAHRRLTATLSADAPYRAATYRGFTPVVADLLKRARAHRS